MNKNILLVVETLSNEKGVNKSAIFEAIEAALATVTARKYPEETDIRVSIDTETGDYHTFRCWTVTDSVALRDEFPHKYIILAEAQQQDASLLPNDVIEESIESIEFGRIAAQQAKQVLLQKVREAERQKTQDRYQERIGDLITGIVKKSTADHTILDLGDGAEGLLQKEDLIPREIFRTGDRVRGYLYAVHSDKRGPQLLISRTRPEMLAELFKIEVPEIGEQVIEIMAVARDPGSRAKLAVKTNDGRIDPIGACIGMRGARVQAVSGELGGERVDIVLWDSNPVQFVINAMAPAAIASIMADEETRTMDVAVNEDQLSQAIGRNGQNIRLASELTGWRLSVMSEAEALNKHTAEAENTKKAFMEALDIEEEVAGALVEQGLVTLEELAFSSDEEMSPIPGLDEESLEELRARARDTLLAKELEMQLNTPEPAQDLLELSGMTEELAIELAKHGILTREDLAEQSIDDLHVIKTLSKAQAAKLIMTARAPWFE